MQYRILIVDGDKVFSENLEKTFQNNGFKVYLINSGKLVLEQAQIIQPHLVLLEVEIPEINGIEICNFFRETSELSNTIVAFLTKQTEDYIQVAAYKAGCDDFIFKTIKPRVLTYRLMALLKRQFEMNKDHKGNLSNNLIGNLVIDPERFVVVVNNKNIYLPKKQFLLLQYLASQPTKVFTRDSISNYIWGQNSKVGFRTIDVYIRKIRERIGLNYIKTIKGVGYRLE